MESNAMPKIGDKLYLRQRTGSYYVDLCKRPYTVKSIISHDKIEIQECELIFNGPRYYDTLPDEIKADPNGDTMILRWNEKRQAWCEYPLRDYPQFAVFGKWEYQPYLD
jgi:hypothetical protein